MKRIMMLVFIVVLSLSATQKTTFISCVGAPQTYIQFNNNQGVFSTPQRTARTNEGDDLAPGWEEGSHFKTADRLFDLTSVHKSDELIIGVQSDRYDEFIDLAQRSGAKLVNTVLMNGEISAVVAEIPSEAKSSFVAKAYVTGLSRYIEPNVQFHIDFVPNDHYWKLQWADRKIGVEYAWNTTTGNADLLVAVVDTGIDYDHPDLAANYAALGYDWVNNDSDPMDDNGHGTHCGGIIAAELNNSIGIAGLAQVRIMTEKAFNQFGEGWEDDLANAIIHAVNQGARIISNSWGSSVESYLIHEAIAYAYSRDVLIIGAAGNDDSSFKQYPAAYDEVVAVSATDEYDNPTSFTNFGDWIEVAAPGLNILSTFWDDTYRYMSGTSMSAPHVAGVAALIWSRFPWMTCDQVRAQLRYTAEDLGDSGFDIYYGYGRVNARRAVEQNPPQHDLLMWDWQKPSYARPGEHVIINASVFNYGIYNESNIEVQLQVNGSIVDSVRIDFLQTGVKKTVHFSWTTSVEGVYVVTCNVMPSIGEENIENNAFSGHVRVIVPRLIEVPKDHKTIQKAVEAAYPGDTVRVAPGIYYEHGTIDKSISLIGEKSSDTVIDVGGYGTAIQVLAPCVNICGFTIKNGGSGIYVSPLSWNNTIANNTILNNFYGLVLMHSAGNILRNNNMTGNKFNFKFVGESLSDFINDIDASNTVDGKPLYYWVKQHDREVPLDAGYVAVIDSTNITARDLNLKNNGQGVLFAYTRDCTIERVNTSSNHWGILLVGSIGDNVSDSDMTNNDYSIDLWNSHGNVLKRNIISNGVDGIYLWRSDGNVITDNTITKNTIHGVLLESSSTNTFGGNIISDNIKGVVLAWSGSNTLGNNAIVNSTRNFGVYGHYLLDFIQNIETSNTINKKSICYLTDQTGITIDSTTFPSIGYLGLINSTSITVKDIGLTRNEQGVLLAYTSNSTVEKINASDNVNGIYLYASKGNGIMGNKLSGNENNGISLQFSESNTISGNVIRDNEGRGIRIYASTGNTASKNAMSSNTLGGIQLGGSNDNWIIQNVMSNNRGYGAEIVDFSSDNVIRRNDIIGNTGGISLDESGGNSLYHNNFIDNVYQVAGVDFWLQENIWDNGREEGNYWSDYAGKDLNDDGIGDTETPHHGLDYFPLMNPYILGDVNHDGTVNIIDIAIVAWSFNSSPGHSRWNLHADLNGDSSINILDIAMVASNFEKKWESFQN